jgi:hypothetical protein
MLNMKKLLIVCIAFSIGTFNGCQDNGAKKINNSNSNTSSTPADVSSGPVMSFDKSSHDFGTINEGEKVTTKCSFTNTGNSDLIIVDARGSCGCTVPSYPKEPIMPGAVGYIKVKYDTKRVGAFTKYVTLTTNATSNTSTRLKIMGTVEAEAPPTPLKEKNMFN